MHPWGFPWLSASDRIKCDLSNKLILFTIDALKAAMEVEFTVAQKRTRGFLEFPEDLGKANLGEPASIWQLPELCIEGMKRQAFQQCVAAGTPYQKPTGVYSDIDFYWMWDGWPAHDSV